ncbi:MAG: PE-PPE domain-containing protein [Mycobacterium sp.]
MRYASRTTSTSRLAMGTALAAVSILTATTSGAAQTVLVVPGTGNPDPTAAFIDREVQNLVTPCQSPPVCTQDPINYPASFWPIILFGLKQLTSDTWNVSVGTGVKNLIYGYTTPATVTGLPTSHPGLTQAFELDPTGTFYIVGYSQGSTVVALFKQDYLNHTLPPNPSGQNTILPQLSQMSFFLGADPNRPNGGLFERPGFFGPFTIPILNATVGDPAPTNSFGQQPNNQTDKINTEDIAIQYDGVSDFPEYPLNVLADANALLGLFLIHPTYVEPKVTSGTGANAHPYGYTVQQFQGDVSAAESSCTTANNCQTYGDTQYITLPTLDLPLLAPLRYLGDKIGLSGVVNPALDLIQPVLQVLIETGYNRTSYGTPTPFQVVIPLNLSAVFGLPAALAKAAVQGIQDAIGDLNGTRKPDTTPLDPVYSPPAGPPVAATTPVTAAAVKTNALKTNTVSTAAVKTAANSVTPATTPPKTPAPKTPPQNPIAKALSGAVNGAANAIRSAINHLHGK